MIFDYREPDGKIIVHHRDDGIPGETDFVGQVARLDMRYMRQLHSPKRGDCVVVFGIPLVVLDFEPEWLAWRVCRDDWRAYILCWRFWLATLEWRLFAGIYNWLEYHRFIPPRSPFAVAPGWRWLGRLIRKEQTNAIHESSESALRG